MPSSPICARRADPIISYRSTACEERGEREFVERAILDEVAIIACDARGEAILLHQFIPGGPFGQPADGVLICAFERILERVKLVPITTSIK